MEITSGHTAGQQPIELTDTPVGIKKHTKTIRKLRNARKNAMDLILAEFDDAFERGHSTHFVPMLSRGHLLNDLKKELKKLGYNPVIFTNPIGKIVMVSLI